MDLLVKMEYIYNGKKFEATHPRESDLTKFIQEIVHRFHRLLLAWLVPISA